MAIELLEDGHSEITINARIKATNVWKDFIAKYPEFEAGNIPKEFLLEKGFVFMNRVGNGQRAIIQQVFDKEGNLVVDFSEQLFLTEEDLNLVRKYTVPDSFKSIDSQSNEEVIDTHEVELIGTEMEDFIKNAQDFVWFWNYMENESPKRLYVDDMYRIQSSVDIMVSVIKDKLGNKLNLYKISAKLISENDRKLCALFTQLNKFLEELEKSLKDRDFVTEKIYGAFDTAKEKYINVIPQTLHGLSPKTITYRVEGKEVVGNEVPFINENGVFGSNNGIYIYDFDGKINGKPTKFRINDICAYLAKHGICNTGIVEDPDQNFITIEEFYNGILLVDADKPIPDSSVYQGIEDEIQSISYKAITGISDLSLELVRFINTVKNTSTLRSNYDRLIDRFLSGDFAK